MGCCATKPRVLKGDEAEQPVRLPSSRWNKEVVDEATEAQNNVEADFNNDNVDVKGKDVLHQTNKRRSLSNLFKEEEMQMLAKTNNTKPEMHASTESEIIRKKMQRQSSKANHEIEHPAEPTKHNKRPELAYIAPENYESLQSKPIPEDNVFANQEMEDPAKAIERNVPGLVYVAPREYEPRQNEVNVITNQEIELIDEPDHVLVAPGEFEPRQSTEAKSAPKVIVEEMEEPAKPTEQIHESDPVRDVAPKTSTDTGKLEKANVTTNQKFKGLVDHKGDPIDGFPGNIDDKSETEAAEDTVKPTKII